MSINSSGLFTADTAVGNYTIAATVGSIVGSTPAAITATATETISVNVTQTFQTMDGFGSSVRMFDDPHLNGAAPTASTGGVIIGQADRDIIISKLWSYTDGIGLNRMRTSPANTNGGWQTTDGGAYVYDAPYPGPQATKTIALLTSILAVNSEFKIGVEPGFDTWVLTTTDAKAAAFIKYQIDYLKAAGFEADWIGVTNEPSLQYGFQYPNKVRDVALQLKLLFDADSQYGDRIRVIAADDVGDSYNATFASAMLNNTTLKPWVKCVATHPYYGLSLTESSAIAVANGIPLWMTEYNASDYVSGVDWASNMIHTMLTTYNLAAWDMLYAFNNGSTSGAPYGYLGMNVAADGVTYTGYTLYPWYFQIGHWSKYVKRGAVRVGASSTTANIKVTAFLKTGKRIIVLINTSGATAYTAAIPTGSYRKIQTVLATGGTDRLTDKGLVSGSTNLPVTSMVTLIEQ